MNIVFAGTPDFASVALQAICQAGHSVSLVLTQPDRPKGRGLKLGISSVKQFAQQVSLPIMQPVGLRLDGRYPDSAAEARARLLETRIDAMVVAAYGLILPPWVLELPRLGCLNIHASLLPRWRGAAPIQRAIESGDVVSGISIMQMDAGLDTGPVLLQESVPIHASDTAGTLEDRLAALGARLIVDVLGKLADGPLVAVAQPEDGMTYAAKITRDEAHLDFDAPALELERRIRAFDPVPGAFALYGDVALKFWRARAGEGDAGSVPGAILGVKHGAITIACRPGVLHVTQVQRAGGVRLAASELVKGFALEPGRRFA